MRPRKNTSLYQSLLATVLAQLICATTAAQITNTRPPNPNITLPGPHAHQPGSSERPPNNAGDVEGFVYWDANTIFHKPAGTCSGLAVNVTAAGSSNNVVKIGNNFKYAGQVKAFLYGGKQAVYDVCIYAYDKLPIGPQLQAQLVVTQPDAFTPFVAAQTTTISPITIINAQCNMLPPIVPSTVGDLTSHWGSCQNRAYDVNFALVPSAHLMGSISGSGGTLLSPNNGAVNRGPINSPSRGMLMGGSNPSPQQSPSSGMLVPAVKPVQTQASASTRRTPGQLVPAKPGAATLTNADIISLTKAGIPESAIINQIVSSTKQFDFSPQGCSVLKGQHVSPKVLDAMSDGSVRPCLAGGVRTATGNGADDLNPQPYPPKGTGARAASANPLMSAAEQTPATLKRGLALASRSKLVLGPRVKISGAGGRGLDSTTTQTIQSESLETHNAKTAVANRVQLAQTSGPQIGSSHILDSTDPATGGSGSDPSGGQPGSVPPGTGTSGGTPLQPAGTPSTQVGGSGGTSHLTMQQMVRAPQPISMCRFTTDPVIETVGGKAHGIILTPDPGSGQYPTNQYAIVGCNFGQTQGDVHIFGQFINNSSPVKLGIDSWSDSVILVTFNPAFQNEYDLKNITLVVVRGDGKNVQWTGVSFVASRVSRFLSSIPHSIVKLPTTYFQNNQFVSPVTPSNLTVARLGTVSQPATSVFYLYDPIWSSNVGDGYPQTRLSFSDTIDFSKLRPGFSLDGDLQTLIAGGPGAQLASDSLSLSDGSCKYIDTLVSASMQGSSLGVGVQPAECDNSGKFIYAYYGLILSVTGPKGDKLNPWPDGLQ